MNTGKRIREFRTNETELSAKDVAWLVGISAQLYEGIEDGEINIHLSQIEEIAKVLQVDPSRLLGDDQPNYIIHIHKERFNLNGPGNQNIKLMYKDGTSPEITDIN